MPASSTARVSPGASSVAGFGGSVVTVIDLTKSLDQVGMEGKSRNYVGEGVRTSWDRWTGRGLAHDFADAGGSGGDGDFGVEGDHFVLRRGVVGAVFSGLCENLIND